MAHRGNAESIVQYVQGDILNNVKKGFFELVVEFDYQEDELKRLVGYSVDGSTIVRMDPRRSFRFDADDMSLAAHRLDAALVQSPQKIRGQQMLYAWRFERNSRAIELGRDTVEIHNVWNHRESVQNGNIAQIEKNFRLRMGYDESYILCPKDRVAIAQMATI